MQSPKSTYQEISQEDSTDRRLLYEIPDFLIKNTLEILEKIEPIYTNSDIMLERRVMTHAFVKVRHDFFAIISLLKLGYFTQATTLASSLMETVYFINYIAIKPEKAKDWINHKEFIWSDNFNNWLVASLANMVKNGDITQIERVKIENLKRNTYSVMCASKHSNGLALRQTNICSLESGIPELTIEPFYTDYSRALCRHIASMVVNLFYEALQFYIDGMQIDEISPDVAEMVLEAKEISAEMHKRFYDSEKTSQNI